MKKRMSLPQKETLYPKNPAIKPIIKKAFPDDSPDLLNQDLFANEVFGWLTDSENKGVKISVKRIDNRIELTNTSTHQRVVYKMLSDGGSTTEGLFSIPPKKGLRLFGTPKADPGSEVFLRGRRTFTSGMVWHGLYEKGLYLGEIQGATKDYPYAAWNITRKNGEEIATTGFMESNVVKINLRRGIEIE